MVAAHFTPFHSITFINFQCHSWLRLWILVFVNISVTGTALPPHPWWLLECLHKSNLHYTKRRSRVWSVLTSEMAEVTGVCLSRVSYKDQSNHNLTLYWKTEPTNNHSCKHTGLLEIMLPTKPRPEAARRSTLLDTAVWGIKPTKMRTPLLYALSFH